MSSTTPTMAGLVAHAGAARLEAVSGALSTHVCGYHQSATWTQGAIAKPDTFMVFDRKNRPTRPLSELSP
jgi:hypothetical protein